MSFLAYKEFHKLYKVCHLTCTKNNYRQFIKKSVTIIIQSIIIQTKSVNGHTKCDINPTKSIIFSKKSYINPTKCGINPTKSIIYYKEV